MLRPKVCVHLKIFDPIKRKNPKTYECETCVKTGGEWVHLRTCQTCDITLCCDSSAAQHATHHFQETGHELVISAEPNEQWVWCYQDQLFLKY